MDISDFKDLLHQRELKATSPRLNLLLEMSKYKSAMPISAIQAALGSLDRVTLYRTIQTLKEQGIIHKAFQASNETYYAICGNQCDTQTHSHDHVHFKCNSCEAVTCEQPTASLKLSIPNSEIHKVSIYVEGLCKQCA